MLIMLIQLLEYLDSMESVPEMFVNVEKRALSKPQTKEDVLFLIKMSRYQIDSDQFPKLKQSEIFAAFNDCKQVLVKSDSDFYI